MILWYKKKKEFLISKNDFMISLNRYDFFFYIKKSILWYQKIIFYISVLWKKDSSRK